MRITKFLIFLLTFVLACEKSDDVSSNQEQTNLTTNNQTEELSENSYDSESTETNTDQTFSREEMLKFIVNQIIIPAYDNLDSSLGDLKTSFDLFNTNVTEENLTDLRNKWLNSYKSWQHVEMYNIGKAMETYFWHKSNIYPVDTTRVNTNVENASYDLENPNNYSAQGFPTIEYLLYGLGDNASKNLIQLNDNIKNRDYLGAIIDALIDNTKTVLRDWNSIKNEFTTSTENSASSNLNMMVNDFIYYYEKNFRANKFGIPGGVFSSVELPDRVEGYFSESFSKELALEGMTSIKNFFNGVSYQDNEVKGHCLKSYLDYIESGKDKLLSNEINAKLDIAENSIKELENNFASQINSDLITILRTYDDIQATVVLLKVDMLQVLDINVDYADADGD